MSITLKKTLYIGLASLMVAGVGATTGNAFNPSSNIVSARRVHRSGARLTARWNRRTGYNRIINGYHAIYNRPSILPHHHIVVSAHRAHRAVQHGVRFRILKGEQFNHDIRYYKIEARNGMEGWIYAGSVRMNHHVRTITRNRIVNHYIARKGLNKHDAKALRTVKSDAIRGELLASLSKISFHNSGASTYDMDHARNELASAQHQTGLIRNRGAHAKAVKITQNFRNYMNSVGKYEVSGETKRQDTMNNQVINDVKSANHMTTAATKGGTNARPYVRTSLAILDKANALNNKLINGSMIRSNKILIRNARSYVESVQRNLAHASHSSSDVIPHHAKPVSPKTARRSNEQIAMDSIKSLHSHAIARVAKIEELLHDPTVKHNSATMAKIGLYASLIRGDKTSMNVLIHQLTNPANIANAQSLLHDING